MKIALMSGAYVNAGDFLIEHRCKELLEKLLRADVTICRRDESYDSRTDELNSFDGIVFGGGPLLQNIYPGKMPFVTRLEEIKVPVYILGCGWKGRRIPEKDDFSDYRFSADMERFIRFVSGQGGIGCRDWYTFRMLRGKGFDHEVMTGCPAWYDLDRIENLELKEKYGKYFFRDDMTIGISDPAMPWNQGRLPELVRILERNFPGAALKVFFHRGISESQQKNMQRLAGKNERISYVDLSGSCRDFALYNDCFFHIGFRVHAHIYNLSQGNISVLINEDARGNGVNHALGLENIDCGQKESGLRRMNEAQFERILMNYLEYVKESDFLQYRRAYFSMRETYKSMEQFVSHMV
ncbi:MAG: polysaccharide pyruvyl transferase family protein [Clostridiales bacterium]|nr:polysaccharide pyruvyl transferase family protein [Clostridiales bacterium]